MQSNPEQAAIIAEKIETLRRGQALAQLIALPGWKEVSEFQQTWLVKHRRELREVSTDDPKKALDALRKWQLAEELVTTQNGYIEDQINEAAKLSGQRTVEEALLMENYRHEQSSTDTGTADPAGY